MAVKVRKHKRMGRWKRRTYKDGSFTLIQGQKIIYVHKSMGVFWVDYKMKDGNVIGTLKPVKTKAQLRKSIEYAKNEFIFTKY